MIKQRPEVLSGATIKIQSSMGTAYNTINSSKDGPFEVFVNVKKGGSDTQAVSEAIGRLCSLVLRMPDGLSQIERMEEIIYQLNGIGGSRPVGDVRSMPDGLAKALKMYLGDDNDTVG
jgi:ribonucleoside-diphosphate reductase alpha chain